MRGVLSREGAAFALRQELLVTLGKGTIVDLETTDLTPSKGGVVCVGTIQSNALRIWVRPREVPFRVFYGYMKGLVRGLPRPFYAYNASFDAKFLKKFLGYPKNDLVVDLFEPWRSRAEAVRRKWPSLDELVGGPWDEIPRDLQEDVVRGIDLPLGAVPEDEEAWLRRGQRHRIPPQVRRVSGKEIPRLWRRYVDKDDRGALEDIVTHNRQDLLKTLCLLLFLD